MLADEASAAAEQAEGAEGGRTAGRKAHKARGPPPVRRFMTWPLFQRVLARDQSVPRHIKKVHPPSRSAYSAPPRPPWPDSSAQRPLIFGQVGLSTAFREVMSYIKGSTEAQATAKGWLSRDEYLGLKSKISPLPVAEREAVYTVFEAYLRLRHHSFDIADLVFHLNTHLDPAAFLPVHRIVCDECQDLTMGELSLLLKAASDKGGLFVCGDTAQTISRGVGFRFTDVKVLFHEVCGASPPLDYLGRNYRTHGGIVDCAAVVVSLLSKLFPTSVDKLERETGHFAGPQPALIHETDPVSLLGIMLAPDDVGMQEMGANQVRACHARPARPGTSPRPH